MFIANSKTEIYDKFSMLFNCTFSLFLGFVKDFEKLRRFIETKKISLNVAADEGDLLLCKLLLCDGAIVYTADTTEPTSLYVAASRGHIDVCKLLINFTTSVNKVNKLNKTALWAAADEGHVDVCKLLLDNEAIVDWDDGWQQNPLYAAVSRGHIDVCKLLINSGASVNKVDVRDKTPLLVAAKRGHTDICILLEDHRADISCMEKEIEPLLDISSQEMRKLLLRWKDEIGKKFRIVHLVTCLVRSSRLALDAISNPLLIL